MLKSLSPEEMQNINSEYEEEMARRKTISEQVGGTTPKLLNFIKFIKKNIAEFDKKGITDSDPRFVKKLRTIQQSWIFNGADPNSDLTFSNSDIEISELKYYKGDNKLARIVFKGFGMYIQIIDPDYKKNEYIQIHHFYELVNNDIKAYNINHDNNNFDIFILQNITDPIWERINITTHHLLNGTDKNTEQKKEIRLQNKQISSLETQHNKMKEKQKRYERKLKQKEFELQKSEEMRENKKNTEMLILQKEIIRLKQRGDNYKLDVQRLYNRAPLHIQQDFRRSHLQKDSFSFSSSSSSSSSSLSSSLSLSSSDPNPKKRRFGKGEI